MKYFGLALIKMMIEKIRNGEIFQILAYMLMYILIVIFGFILALTIPVLVLNRSGNEHIEYMEKSIKWVTTILFIQAAFYLIAGFKVASTTTITALISTALTISGIVSGICCILLLCMPIYINLKSNRETRETEKLLRERSEYFMNNIFSKPFETKNKTIK